MVRESLGRLQCLIDRHLEVVEPSRMKAELVPENGDPPIPIVRDISVVGRREYCDIRIDHSTISKRHCVIVRTAGLLILRDLATTNGTKVKGQRVRWAALLPGDKVTIGGYKLQVFLGPDDVPSPSEMRARNPLVNTSFAAPTPPSSQLARQRLPKSSVTERAGSTPKRPMPPIPTPSPSPLPPNVPAPIELGDADVVELDEDDVVEMEIDEVGDEGWKKMRFPAEVEQASQQFFIELEDEQ